MWSKTKNEDNRTHLVWIDVFYKSFQSGHEAGGQVTVLKKHPLPTLHSGSHHSFSTRALKTVNNVPMEFRIQQSFTVKYAHAEKWMCFKYMQRSSFKLNLENVNLSKDNFEDSEFDNWKIHFALRQYFNYSHACKICPKDHGIKEVSAVWG